MEPRSWDDDEQLLADLRDALREAGPVDAAVAAGQAAYSWRTIDEELALASLVFDSRLDAGLVTRADSAARELVFETGSVGIGVEVVDGDLLGHVSPAAAGEVHLVDAQGAVVGSAEVDEFGCFSMPLADGGPMRLRYRAGATDVVTEWIGRWD